MWTSSSETLVFLAPSPFPVSSRFEGLGLGGSFRIWTAAAPTTKGLLKTPPSLGREISSGGVAYASAKLVRYNSYLLALLCICHLLSLQCDQGHTGWHVWYAEGPCGFKELES